MKKWHTWKSEIKRIYLPCCFRVKPSRWITEPAKEIGLGASLFLMTLKAFFWMFCVLALINVPLMFIYLGGNGLSETLPGFVGFLGKFTLGNLGTSSMVCNRVNVANYEKNFFLSCPYGTMRELFNFGLQKNDNSTCQRDTGTYLGEGDHWEDLQYDCSLENGLNPIGKENLLKTFEF